MTKCLFSTLNASSLYVYSSCIPERISNVCFARVFARARVRPFRFVFRVQASYALVRRLRRLLSRLGGLARSMGAVSGVNLPTNESAQGMRERASDRPQVRQATVVEYRSDRLEIPLTGGLGVREESLFLSVSSPPLPPSLLFICRNRSPRLTKKSMFPSSLPPDVLSTAIRAPSASRSQQTRRV